MRKFSKDNYEELYMRIIHKANNKLLLILTHIDIKRMGRKLVWRKQRAKEQYALLMELLEELPKPKE